MLTRSMSQQPVRRPRQEQDTSLLIRNQKLSSVMTINLSRNEAITSERRIGAKITQV